MRQKYYLEHAETGRSIYASVEPEETADGIKEILRYAFDVPNTFLPNSPGYPETKHSEEFFGGEDSLRATMMRLLEREVYAFESIVNA